jgi:hypothetical protein
MPAKVARDEPERWGIVVDYVMDAFEIINERGWFMLPIAPADSVYKIK